MKMIPILEMPYEIAGSMLKNSNEKSEETKLTTISDFTLGRDYVHIGSMLPADSSWGVVKFHLGRPNVMLIGTISVLAKTGKFKTEIRNKAIFNLNFKLGTTLECEIPEFDGRTLLQVNRVRTDDYARGLGIGISAYVNLAKHGYVVLSDSTQFTDGKMLWKSIIDESDLKNYKIAIVNVETGIIGKYDDIEDSEIWTSEQDYSGERILLALYK